MVDKIQLTIGVFILIALVGTVYFLAEGDKAYSCSDGNQTVVGICFKLSAINQDGLQTRCYYNQSAPTRYKNCNSGWNEYKEEIIGEEVYTKTYISETKTAIITNKITTDTISELKLNTPQKYNIFPGKNRLFGEVNIDNKKIYLKNIIDNMKFYDLNNGGKEIDRIFTYKLKEVTIVNETRNYITCSEPSNETKQICYDNFKEVQVEKITWKDFDMNKELQPGVYTIGFFTDVYEGDNIEWVPTLYSQSIDEWAVWTSNLNDSLTDYWSANQSGSTSSLINSWNGARNGTFVEWAGSAWVLRNIVWAVGLNNASIGDNSAVQGGINITTSGNGFYALNHSQAWSFWIYPTSHLDADRLIAQYNDNVGPENGFWNIYLNAGVVTFAHRYGGTTYTKATGYTVTDGAWQHIVLTRDSTGNNSIYVNGNLQASLVTTDTPYIQYLTFASYMDGGTQFKGRMDEIGHFNRNLSDQEISDLYNGGTGIWPSVPNTNSITHIVSPSNKTATTNNTVQFTCNASDTSTSTMIFYIFDSSLSTINRTVINISGATNHSAVNITLNPGKYTWNCWSNTTTGYFNWSTEGNYSLNITACLFNGLVRDNSNNLLSGMMVKIANQTSNNTIDYVTMTNSTGGWNYTINIAGNYSVWAYDPLNSSRKADIHTYVNCTPV